MLFIMAGTWDDDCVFVFVEGDLSGHTGAHDGYIRELFGIVVDVVVSSVCIDPRCLNMQNSRLGNCEVFGRRVVGLRWWQTGC